MKRLLFIFLFVSSVHSFNSNDMGSILTLGPISFKVIESGKSNRSFVWLHGDEKTAKMALDHHIKIYEGKAFYINSDERIVRINGNRIDPNRVFSRNGAKKSLIKYDSNLKPSNLKKILDSIDIGKETFLKQFLPNSNGLVIAIHNNSRGYTIKSEIKNSIKYSIKKNQRFQDFYICTNSNDYKILEKSPYNVVLLNNVLKDDGSLSILMKKMNVRYINVEVKLGWLSKQKKMLEYIEENLP